LGHAVASVKKVLRLLLYPINYYIMIRWALLVVIVMLTVSCFGGLANAVSVGVAPPVLDAGVMIPGESKVMEFFLMSDHESDLLVDLSTKGAKRDFFSPEKPRFRYSFEANKASEEDISDWLTFLKDSVIVPPEKSLRYLKGGGVANANKKVEVIVSVPEDAEPGYHAAYVLPYPRLGIDGSGTGLGIITLVEMAYIVNVVGDAVRGAEIAGIHFVRTSQDRGKIELLVKNIGTVTMSVAAENIRVFDKEAATIAEIDSNEKKVAPGRVVTLEAWLDIKDLEGRYGVEASADWLTGEDTFVGWFEVVGDAPDQVPPLEITGKAVAPPISPQIPLWAFLLALILGLGVFYWRLR
jgi:hypothetical protein